MSSWFIVEILIAVLVALQITSFIFIVKMKSRLMRQQLRIEQLSHEQQAIVSGNLGLGRKLFQFKNNLHHLEQSQVEMEQTHTNSGAFEQAATMISKGIPLDDVIESCQISRGEAELLQEMIATTSFH